VTGRWGIFVFCLAALGAAQEAPSKPPIVLGYYPSWVSHPNAREIRYERFTHLAHAFLRADREGRLLEDRAIPSSELARAAHEHGVRVLISLGGAQSAKVFRDIVDHRDSLDRYAAAVAGLLTENGYDGMDVDWEPTEGDTDREGIVRLVRALRTAAPRAILSMAAPTSDWQGRAWDVEALRKAVDFLNVMTYDFHGPWSPHAGHNAPLQAAPDDEDGAVASVENGMAYWSEQRKWPRDRLNVGIPCYGRGFAVRQWHQKPAGKPIHESIDAHDIPTLLRQGWRRVWDPQVGVPTLLKEGVPELISYEDEESAARKGAWSREKGFRGIFFWNIEQDWLEGDHSVVRAAAASFLKR
jgi:chitinase